MREAFHRLTPFTTPEAQRLAGLFAIVYFAQGMWYLPNQTIMIVLKDAGLGAGMIANFFVVSGAPWLVKPVYGMLSDFFPLFGRRRLSYFVLSSSVAGAAAFTVGVTGTREYWPLMLLFTAMGLGLAFTDVLTDALMVENGKPLGLTGTFQSVQWAALSASSILVGVAGGYLAEHRAFAAAFALVACFPLISLLMAWLVVQEPPARPDLEGLGETWAALRQAAGRRDLWLVASFIFFWAFSPSFGPAFFYYQTDTLHFSQTLIGGLASLGAAASIAGAWAYARLARRFSLKRLIVWSIGAGTVGSLAYLAYGGVVSATVITVVFGAVGMTTQLAFLDLAAKACPARAEATFFALLMSINNLGARSSEWTGANLYDWLGYTPLVLISTAFTAAAWLLVPLVPIDAIQAAAARAESPPAADA
jgi:MFS family permease